jgi:ParB-like chromosome segregation protein Spo0J
MDINSSTLSFRITLIDLDDLKPHEEIIQHAVMELAKAIHDENEVRDPLMVDEQSFVILDGMHRYNAFRPVC